MIVMQGWKMRRLPLWTLLCLTTPAHAAQVAGVQVTRNGTHFLIDMQIAIDAPAQAVFRALQDYAAMARYNPDLRSVRVEPTATPHRVRLFTAVHTCVLIFCKMMHQEQIMTATATADGGALHARLVAGDFKGGYGLWTVRPCPAARAVSCLSVRIELVPAFWVPPVIGPWVIRRKMDEEARRTSAGLERTALGFGR
ncbi:MAG: SRPBCC family protein [Gammaproteobacteria bacterium]|nr:SRPBCC family protein [Gammaproteobacteria bacterium]